MRPPPHKLAMGKAMPVTGNERADELANIGMAPFLG